MNKHFPLEGQQLLNVVVFDEQKNIFEGRLYMVISHCTLVYRLTGCIKHVLVFTKRFQWQFCGTDQQWFWQQTYRSDTAIISVKHTKVCLEQCLIFNILIFLVHTYCSVCYNYIKVYIIIKITKKVKYF